MSTRLDFVILEKFFEDNPHFTDEVKSEARRHLDRVQNDVVDRNHPEIKTSEFPNSTIIDIDELATFFKQHPHLASYKAQDDVAVPGISGWEVAFAAYVRKHVALDYVQQLCNLYDFPIAPTDQLGSDPTANLKLSVQFWSYKVEKFLSAETFPKHQFMGPYLDEDMSQLREGEPFYSQSERTRAWSKPHRYERFIQYDDPIATRKKDDPKNIRYVSLDFGPIVFKTRCHPSEPPQSLADNTFSYELQDDPAFWDLIDPSERRLDLSLKFKIVVQEVLGGRETHVLSEIPHLVEEILARLDEEIKPPDLNPVQDRQAEPTFEERCRLNSERDREAFEDFLAHPVYRECFLSESIQWSYPMKEAFFASFSGLSNLDPKATVFMQGGRFEFQRNDYKKRDYQTYAIRTGEFLESNGYRVFEHTVDGSILVVKSVTDFTYQSASMSAPKTLMVDTEPVSTYDEQVLRSHMDLQFRKKEFLNPYTWSNFAGRGEDVDGRDEIENTIDWDFLPVIASLSRRDLPSYMRARAGWSVPLMEGFGEVEFEAMSKFVSDFISSYNLFNHPDVRFVEGPHEMRSMIAALFDAIFKSQSPRACLIFAIFVASTDNPVGQLFLRILPYVMNELVYYHDTSYDADDGTLFIQAEERAFANARYAWDVPTLIQAASVLEALDDEMISQILGGVDFSFYDSAERFVRHNFNTQVEKHADIMNEVPDLVGDVVYVHEGLVVETLLKYAKRDSTKKKIQALDYLKNGVISVTDLLSQQWSNAERQDIKVVLKKYHKKVGGDDFLEDLKFDELKAPVANELLPTEVLRDLIVKGGLVFREPLWRALFRKDDRVALKLLEETILAVKDLEEGATSNRMYPSREDVLFTVPYASSCQRPEAAQIFSKYEKYLVQQTEIAIFVHAKLGNVDYLNNRLLQAFDEIEAIEKQYKGFQDQPYTELICLQRIDDVLERYFAFTGRIPFDEKRDKILQRKLGPLYPYLNAKYGLNPDAAVDPKEAYLVYTKKLLSVVSDMKKNPENWGRWSVKDHDLNYNNNPKGHFPAFAMLCDLVDFLDQHEDLKTNPQTVEPIYQIVHELLTTVGTSLDITRDLQPIVDRLLSPSEIGAKAPDTFLISAHICGASWALQELDLSSSFVRTPQGTVFRPSLDVYFTLKAFDFVSDAFRAQSPHLVSLMDFYKSLWDEFGPFTIELPDGIDAAWREKLRGGPWSPTDFDKKIHVFPYMKAYHGIDLDDILSGKESLSLGLLDSRDPIKARILANLLQASKTYRERVDSQYFSDWGEHPPENISRSILSVSESEFYPLDEMLMSIEAIKKYDRIKMPDTAFSLDHFNADVEELLAYEEKIYSTYLDVCRNVLEISHLQANGFPIETSQPARWSDLYLEEGESDCLSYVILLTEALQGDSEAIEELWLYQRGEKKLVSVHKPYDQVCELLKVTGAEFLKSYDPDRFLLGGLNVDVDPEQRMALYEFGVPNADQPDLAGHVEIAEGSTAQVRHHSTSTARVALGNVGRQREASGMVRSYAITQTGLNAFQNFGELLDMVLRDIEKKNIDISVLSVSLALYGGSMNEKSFEEFKKSDLYLEVQRKVHRLRHKHNVVFVLAAGNMGEMGDADPFGSQGLAYLNFYATIDPGIIVVGASRLPKSKGLDQREKDKKTGLPMTHPELEIQIKESSFSSEGNVFIHPDVVNFGEGFNILSDLGLDMDQSGSSISAPMTTRLIAAMRTLNPRLSSEMIQAILKMTAEDIPGVEPEKEGAGQIMAADCLYVAQVLKGIKFKKRRQAIARELGIHPERAANLDWLANRIRFQVWFTDTNQQNYGD